MPFYEYECKSCGHTLEAMQKVSDSPLKKCPECGKSQLQRLMSAPVFRLKGGGWYETDFKGDQDNKRNLADRPEADAPKDEAKDTAKDAAKDGAAAGADGKGKDGKASEAPAVKEAASKDKAADKPVEKAPAESSKKVASSRTGHSSTRGRSGSAGKSAAKTPVKRPVKKTAAKTKRRR
jgi:putative FmdB family regulatory protein